MSDTKHPAQTGSAKNPQSLLTAGLLALVAVVAVIIGIVSYVSAGVQPQATGPDAERALATRIQKVGMVELRKASATLRTGEEVYKGQCFACHATGVSGAPKFGDAAAWAPRIATGFDTLVNSALKGKNLMGPQGGGNFSDLEIARAVAFMGSAGGAKFSEPQSAAAK